MISMRSARHCLAALWLALGSLLVVFVSIQMTMDVYGTSSRDVWEWLVPNIVPTMTLVIGALAADLRPTIHDYKVSRMFFFVAFGLSFVYLVFLIVLVFYSVAHVPEDPEVGSPALKAMQRATFGIGALQGLVALSLGAFFVQRSE